MGTFIKQFALRKITFTFQIYNAALALSVK